MSENGDESSDFDTAMNGDGPNEYTLELQANAQYYSMPSLRHIPVELRSYARSLALEVDDLLEGKGTVTRKVKHHPVSQEQKEICMDSGCNKLTNIKCMTCHIFACIDCFENFHVTDD